MFWTFLATFVVFAVFMLALGLNVLVGRRKRECSCGAAKRMMANRTRANRQGNGENKPDSPLKILDQDGGCSCNER
jgi:hypothetical protein